MKDNRKTIQVLIILTIIFSIMGGSLAYLNWNTTTSQRTNVVFTVEREFSCAADGGGDITTGDVYLIPTVCTDSERTIKREITVTPTINKDDLSIHMNLWLNVNRMDSGLSKSVNFKYALTTSSANCTDGVISTGSFYGTASGDEVKILGKTYDDSTPQTYYLWIWLDAAETSSTVTNQKFSLSLGGDCNDEATDLLYNVASINNDTSKFGVVSGFYTLSNYNCENGATLSYDTNSKELTSSGVDKCDLEFTSLEKTLYDVVEIGDYIEYAGANGCSGNQCNGWNHNQTNQENYFGQCGYGLYNVYGWRVLYKTDNSVYIISAGAPECVTEASNSITTIANVNTASYKYCNNTYLEGGECNINTAHAFNENDFYQFTSQYYGANNARYLYNYENNGSTADTYCYGKHSSTYCGYNNDIIDNGGDYWFANAYSSTAELIWTSRDRYVRNDYSDTTTYGIRPVLKLDSSIMAIGGNGTIESPYMISTRSGL